MLTMAKNNTMRTTDISLVPGVAESALDPAAVAGLPANEAPAPWQCRAQAVLWFGRGGKNAARALAGTLGGDARALTVVGGMVRYLDTPVGSYDEVLGSVGYRSGRRLVGNVAFMAVDSPTSLVGGRSNWAMPKTLATFGGSPTAGATMSAEGANWRVRATATAFGPALPLPGLAATVVQRWPDGQLRDNPLRAGGRFRAAVVRVEVESDLRSGLTLPMWLRPGRHAGVVFESFDFTLGAPLDAAAT
jgi:hypothetical protein